MANAKRTFKTCEFGGKSPGKGTVAITAKVPIGKGNVDGLHALLANSQLNVALSVDALGKNDAEGQSKFLQTGAEFAGVADCHNVSFSATECRFKLSFNRESIGDKGSQLLEHIAFRPGTLVVEKTGAAGSNSEANED